MPGRDTGLRRLLVTGAAGYLGSAAVPALVTDGFDVVVATRHGQNSPADVRTVTLDLRSEESVAAAVDAIRPGMVVHLAAYVPRRRSDSADNDVELSRLVNFAATSHLVRIARDAGVRRFIFASSISVYPESPADGLAFDEDDPLDPRGAYGRDKARAEAAITEVAGIGMDAVILRFAGIHGPPREEGVVANFCRAALNGEPLQVAEPTTCINLLFRRDAAAACVAAAQLAPGGGVIVANVAGKEEVSLERLARILIGRTEDRSPMLPGDRPGRRQVMRISRARALLGYEPTPLDRCLTECLDFARTA
jgi:UDP-glucose 4-epimerase